MFLPSWRGLLSALSGCSNAASTMGAVTLAMNATRSFHASACSNGRITIHSGRYRKGARRRQNWDTRAVAKNMFKGMLFA
jgi:hypothetical protein